MYKAPTRWWAYHEEHRWVVLDREWPGNESGIGCELTFVRCSDWSLFTDSFSSWPSPAYFWAPRKLEQLEDQERLKTQNLLKLYEKEYECRRAQLLRNLVEKRHNDFIKSKGHPPSEGMGRTQREHRTANCYGCNRHLDNAIDYECLKCRWIICWHCGACGCGWWAT